MCQQYITYSIPVHYVLIHFGLDHVLADRHVVLLLHSGVIWLCILGAICNKVTLHMASISFISGYIVTPLAITPLAPIFQLLIKLFHQLFITPLRVCWVTYCWPASFYGAAFTAFIMVESPFRSKYLSNASFASSKDDISFIPSIRGLLWSVSPFKNCHRPIASLVAASAVRYPLNTWYWISVT